MDDLIRLEDVRERVQDPDGVDHDVDLPGDALDEQRRVEGVPPDAVPFEGCADALAVRAVETSLEPADPGRQPGRARQRLEESTASTKPSEGSAEAV